MPDFRSSLSVAFAWLVLLVACEPPQAPHRRVRFEVRDDLGRPLRDAAIRVEGRILGHTGRDGVLKASLQGHEGDLLQAAATCPKGYDDPRGPDRIMLRSVQHLEASEHRRGLQTIWRCAPQERTVALVVRAGQRGIPVLVEGETRARTDPDGTAHLLLKRTPHRKVHVQLDTSEHPRLRPRSPARAFRLEDEDALWLFAPTLRRTPRARPRRKPRPHRPPTPYRLR